MESRCVPRREVRPCGPYSSLVPDHGPRGALSRAPRAAVDGCCLARVRHAVIACGIRICSRGSACSDRGRTSRHAAAARASVSFPRSTSTPRAGRRRRRRWRWRRPTGSPCGFFVPRRDLPPRHVQWWKEDSPSFRPLKQTRDPARTDRRDPSELSGTRDVWTPSSSTNSRSKQRVLAHAPAALITGPRRGPLRGSLPVLAPPRPVNRPPKRAADAERPRRGRRVHSGNPCCPATRPLSAHRSPPRGMASCPIENLRASSFPFA